MDLGGWGDARTCAVCVCVRTCACASVYVCVCVCVCERCTRPEGKCSSVSGRATAAAFDHDIHGCAAAVGLWNLTRCVRKVSSAPVKHKHSKIMEDHNKPNGGDGKI